MIAVAAFGAGCDRDGPVRAYAAPKESASPSPIVAADAAPAPGAETIGWTVPPDWKPVAGDAMRFASFAVDPAHPDLVLTVVCLGREARALQPNVNRWEGQLGLPPTPEAELQKVVKARVVAGNPAALVDLTGPRSAGKQPQRLLAAIVAREQKTWFFKLAGPADWIAPKKAMFEAFVDSIHFQPATPDAPQAAPEASAPPTTPALPAGPATGITFKAPADWVQDAQPTPPRVLSFQVPSASGAGEVTVLSFDQNNVGPLLANLNRWRGQVGLEPVADASADKPAEIDMAGGKGMMFDFTGPQKDSAPSQRMLVAIAVAGEKSEQFWFFKLKGPADLVAGQKSAFQDFLKSVRLGGDSQ